MFSHLRRSQTTTPHFRTFRVAGVAALMAIGMVAGDGAPAFLASHASDFATVAGAQVGTAGGTIVADTVTSSVDPATIETPLEQALLDHTNADRLARGLAPLSFDPLTLQVARTRATTQLALPSLSHFDSNGKLAFVGLLSDAGATYQLAGENLARLNAPEDTAADRAEVALMNSPAHRANILEPSYDHLAIGAAEDASGRIVYAEIYRATGQNG